MKNLQITFENLETQNGLITVNLTGRLNEMNAIDFKKDLLKILEDKNSNCLLDITLLSSMDIIGINAIVMAHRALEKKGKTLSIISEKESTVDRAFHLTKFDRILNLKRA